MTISRRLLGLLLLLPARALDATAGLSAVIDNS